MSLDASATAAEDAGTESAVPVDDATATDDLLDAFAAPPRSPIARWIDPRQDRFWWTLLGLGIVLRFVGSLQSGLGVDAHLHAAYAQGWLGGTDFDPGWGPVRNPANAQASNPEAAAHIGGKYLVWHLWLAGWFSVLGPSVAVMHLASLMISALLLVAVYWFTRRLFEARVALRLTALVSIHPLLILTAAMGYQEEFVSLLMVLSCAAVLGGVAQLERRGMPWWWLAGIPLAAALSLTKGLRWEVAVTATVAVGAWLLLERLSAARGDWLRHHPLKVLGGLTGLIWLAMIGVGIADSTGSFAYAVEHPGRLSLALLLSASTMIVVWFGLGLVVWPFLPYLARRLTSGEVSSAALNLLVLVALPLGVVIGYNAALWTYESTLIGRSLWLMPFTGIQNVRYLTILLVPVHWLVLQVAADEARPRAPEVTMTSTMRLAWRAAMAAPGSLARLEGRSVMLAATVLLLVPLAAVAAIVGEDAAPEQVAEEVGEVLGDGEDFLLVTSNKSGAHRLYQMRLAVDPDGDRGITGHWRSGSTGWIDEVQNCSRVTHTGDLREVSVIVLTPAIEAAVPPAWVEATGLDLPDGWRVLRPAGETAPCST